MKDREHWRVRVHRSTMKEAGTCSNRKVLYLDEIENAVLAGRQQHPKAPKLQKEFVKTDQEGRERLTAEKVRRRGRLESKLAEVRRSLDRMCSDYEAECVPVEVLRVQLYFGSCCNFTLKVAPPPGVSPTEIVPR